MGVLSNGAPFLTIRGLARMCGVDHTAIVRLTDEWASGLDRPRLTRIRELVRSQGADDTVAFVAVIKDGTVHHAVPDALCMAVLEYYAFESPAGEQALKSYRTLARKGFRDFIYSQVGYNPNRRCWGRLAAVPRRVSLSYHTVPDGYFSVFKEMADVMVTLIRGGASLGEKFIPDISVGKAWGKKWTAENLDNVDGARHRYEHNYPACFPQALSNPRPAYCYPDDALPEFRRWMKETYVPGQMPAYLNGKVAKGKIPAPAAAKAIEASTRASCWGAPNRRGSPCGVSMQPALV
jgi:hypothetical protein